MSDDAPEIDFEEVNQIMMECIQRLMRLGLPDVYIALLLVEAGQQKLKRLTEEQGPKH